MYIVITVRKRSLRRLCFYTCQSVILFTWGEYLGSYTSPSGRYTPLAGTPPGRYTPQAGTVPQAGTSPPGPGTPPGRYTPRAGTPWQVNPQAGTPPSRYPRGRYTPRAGTPPLAGTPPESSACWEIRTTSGRYCILLECILVILAFNVHCNLMYINYSFAPRKLAGKSKVVLLSHKIMKIVNWDLFPEKAQFPRNFWEIRYALNHMKLKMRLYRSTQ